VPKVELNLTLEDLAPFEAVTPAQAVVHDGMVIHAALFLDRNQMIHVGNVSAPRATTATPIKDTIAEKLRQPG